MADFTCIVNKQYRTITIEFSGENIAQLDPKTNMELFDCGADWLFIGTNTLTTYKRTYFFQNSGSFEEAIERFKLRIHSHISKTNPSLQNIKVYTVVQESASVAVSAVSSSSSHADFFPRYHDVEAKVLDIAPKKPIAKVLDAPPKKPITKVLDAVDAAPEKPIIKINFLSDPFESKHALIVIHVSAPSALIARSQQAEGIMKKVAEQYAEVSFLNCANLISKEKRFYKEEHSRKEERSYAVYMFARPTSLNSREFVETIVPKIGIALEEDGFKSKEFKINICGLPIRSTSKQYPASWPGTPRGEARKRLATLMSKLPDEDQKTSNAESEGVGLFSQIKAQILLVRELISDVEESRARYMQVMEDLEEFTSISDCSIDADPQQYVDLLDYEFSACNSLDIYTTCGIDSSIPAYKCYDGLLEIFFSDLKETFSIFNREALIKMEDIEIAKKIYTDNLSCKARELGEKITHTRDVLDGFEILLAFNPPWKQFLDALNKLDELARRYVSETTAALFTL